MQGRNACASMRGTVTVHTRHAHLHANMAEAAFHELARIVDNLGNLAAFGMRVAIDSLAALPAEHLVHRHAGLAALDIPERLVDAADGVIKHWPVAPVRAVVAGLPGVFDAVRRLADQKRLQILFNRRVHQLRPLCEGRTTIAIEAVLIGSDLDDGKTQAGGRGGDNGDVADLRRRHAARGASLCFSKAIREEASHARGTSHPQELSSIHRPGYRLSLSSTMLFKRSISRRILRSRKVSISV